MIPHVVLRNTVIPLAAALYYLHVVYKRRLTPVYRLAPAALYTATVASIILAAAGRNPAQILRVDGWRSPWCTAEYLVFASLATAAALRRKHPPGFAVTLAVFAAGAAGYLYEAPIWLRSDGVRGLLRTAARSWSVLDWGFLSVFLFLWMVGSAGVEWRRPRVLAGAALYGGYVVFWPCFLRWALQMCRLCPAPSSFFYRAPAFLFILAVVASLKSSRFAWCS